MPRLRILLVEDDEAFRERLARALRDRGQDVVTARDRAGAAMVASAPIDAALVDLRLERDSGLDVVADLRRLWRDAVLVIATGSPAETPQLLATVASSVLSKPFDADDVLAHLRPNLRDE